MHKFFFEKKGILKFSKKTENHDFQGGPGASEVRFQKKFKYYASRFGSSNGLRTSPRSFLGAPFGLNLSCERGGPIWSQFSKKNSGNINSCL